MKISNAFAAMFASMTLAAVGCGGATHQCPHHAAVDAAKIRAEVDGILRAQVEAWNRGDLDGFMAGYEKGDAVIYTSSGEIQRGWQTAYDRYKRAYPDLRQAGVLRLTLDDVTPLGDGAAVALGHWYLDGEKKRGGVFSLVLRRDREGWRIIHDHTSSFKEPAQE